MGRRILWNLLNRQQSVWDNLKAAWLPIDPAVKFCKLLSNVKFALPSISGSVIRLNCIELLKMLRQDFFRIRLKALSRPIFFRLEDSNEEELEDYETYLVVGCQLIGQLSAETKSCLLACLPRWSTSTCFLIMILIFIGLLLWDTIL